MNDSLTTVEAVAELENLISNSQSRLGGFQDAKFGLLFEQRVQSLFHTGIPKVISVDLFDTLLLRREISELRHFYLIANRLATALESVGLNKSPESVLIARYISTELSYRLSERIMGCREGNIIDIHSGIHQILRSNHLFDVQKSVNIEVQLEIESLLPNKPLWEQLRKYKEAGSTIFIISDMYIPANLLFSITEHFFSDLGLVVDKLISSADTKYSKGAGIQFDLLLEQQKLDPKEVLHVGDNLISDYRRPLERGIFSIHLPIPNYMEKRKEEDKQNLLNEFAEKGFNFQYFVR